jgi:ribonuclease BN (tRNA processing enzyme)
MRVVLHGVLGSTAAPGIDFVRVGGHTSCVAITLAGQIAPTLLLDAGTGLTSVTASLDGRAYSGDILLTHLHWDHVQGLPFFAAGDRDDSSVRLMLPAQDEASSSLPDSAVRLLARSMSPPHFPITPDGLRGRWRFHAIEAGHLMAGGCRVLARQVPHKGGRTFGFRVEADGSALAYLPDHAPETAPQAGVELAQGVDILLHGGMFAESERATARGYGHATVGDAHRLARAAGVGALVLIHHAPMRTDDEVEVLAASLNDPRVTAGREGDVVLETC